MKRELSFHPEIEFIYRDANGDNERQVSDVQKLLNQPIDLMIISPNEAEPLTPIVDEVFRRGIPVVVTDRKTSSGLYHAYVGSDNFDIGFLAGRYLAYGLEGRGEVAVISGLKGSSASIEREKGFKAALKDYPNLRIKKELTGDWLQTTAYERVGASVSQLGLVDALFAFNDQMAIGAKRALNEHFPNHRTKIVGVDALPGDGNGLDQVANGSLDASMLYATGGTECIRTAIAILNQQPYARENILNTLVIDSVNVQLMKMQADKIDSQQQDIDEQQLLLAEQRAIYQDQQSTLNILVASLVFAVVFAGVSIYALKSNWEKNKHLEQQNLEILNQQKQLIKMSEQIKEASVAKSNFFTNLSHEFKTPLTLILAPVEDLLQVQPLTSSIKEQLVRIRRNGLRLMRLVSELIDIQRFEKEKIRLHASPQSLPVFLNQIILSFKPLSQKKHIAISLENRSSSSQVWFDPHLMEKVFYNLLSNALKFTPAYGKIQIFIEPESKGENLLVRVKDSGRGIASAHLAHVFETFYQANEHPGGSGLGLALVKEIVSLHHGVISVSSREGEGTCFTLTLPLGDAHLKMSEKSTVQKTDVLNDPFKLESPEDVSAPFAPDIAEPSDNVPDSEKMYSLLIVDDNEEILQFLEQRLQSNYEVYAAKDVNSALDLAYEKTPDLIISDVVMPESSGIELVRSLKNDTRTSFIPVILLTAMDAEEKKAEGLLSMADAYVTKPFNIRHLSLLIDNLIRNRQELKQRFMSEIGLAHELSHTRALDKKFLNKLSAAVENHLADSQFTVEDLASAVGVSRVQLYRKVKTLLNCSVNDYVISRRLKRAKYLLQQDLSINEIADQSGFSSPGYFATLFKQKYGKSPSVFRKNAQ